MVFRQPKYIRVVAIALAFFLSEASFAQESTCYGTLAKGSLKNGVALPLTGTNFQAYSALAASLGRTFVHSTVRDIVVESYQTLQDSYPNQQFVYAETGLPEGGYFKPHKTHQNGLSIDFFVPVKRNGVSVPLPADYSNRLGYDIEFDKNGSFGEYQIDFEAMANHIMAIYHSAEQRGVGISKIIFDPRLQPLLWRTQHGKFIKSHIRFNHKQAWVRHDEHYHIDFAVNCQPKKL